MHDHATHAHDHDCHHHGLFWLVSVLLFLNIAALVSLVVIVLLYFQPKTTTVIEPVEETTETVVS